ncbi:MAG: hypothetical protein NC115_11370 [Bacteroidales bacterium]|nr:hypothetical protein [Bacteroidales bacterium]
MKTNFWKMAPALLMGLAISVASCEKPASGPEEVQPIFPEQVYGTVEPGDSYILTINPNLAWEVAISGDTQYFRMISGGEPLPVVSGQAGEHEITVEAIVDETDFEQRQCTLTMTMGGKEQAIAVITRNGRDRIFNLYPVQITSEGFEYGEDVGGYEYETVAAEAFDMYFDGNIFQLYMKVEANFDWALKDTPEWAEATEFADRYVTSGKANVPAAICLRGVNAKYPLDGDKGNLVFVVNDDSENPVEVEKEITLSIEPVKDVFAATMAGSLRFNAAGDFYNEGMGDWQVGGRASGSAIGIDGVQVFALEKQYGYYTVAGSSKKYPYLSGGWVNVTLSEDDETDVLKDWSIALRVEENEGNARTAEIMVIPGFINITDPEYDLVSPDGSEIKAEYAKYVYATLSQDGIGGSGSEGGVISADNDVLAGMGAMFEKLDASDPEYAWIYDAEEVFNAGTGNYFKLTMTKPMGNFTFNVEKEMFDIALYDYGDGFVQSAEPWVEVTGGTATSLMTLISLTDDDKWAFKFMVFKGEDSAANAVVLVYYDPEASIGAGSVLRFKYSSWGGGAGCSLRKMSEAEDGENEYYWAAKENFWNSDEIYELTYGPNRSMPNIESSLEFTGFYNLLEDAESWLTAEGDASDLFIDMGESEEARQGILIFTDNSEDYPMPVFAVICRYDPNF